MYHHHAWSAGAHPAFLIIRLILLALFVLVPLIVALAYIWRDARSRGQPGWLWALTTIFLGWLGILVYLVVRAFTRPPVAAPPNRADVAPAPLPPAPRTAPPDAPPDAPSAEYPSASGNPPAE